MKKILSAVFAFLLSFAVAEPVATPTDLAGEGDVSVSIKLVTPADEIRYGNIITMECVVEGTNDAFEVFWEYSEDGVNFQDIGVRTMTCSYILTEKNVNYTYRVRIRIDSSGQNSKLSKHIYWISSWR